MHPGQVTTAVTTAIKLDFISLAKWTRVYQNGPKVEQSQSKGDQKWIGLPPTVQPFATVQPFQTPTLDKIFLYGAFKRRAKGRYSGRRAQDTKALSRIGLLWLWLTLKGYGWLYRL